VTKRNRARRPARSQPFLEPKPTILVVSEGEVTEPEYLYGFIQFVKNPRVDVEVLGVGGAPRTLVESAKDRKKANEKRALRERDDNLRYDQVWCVFDIDEHPNPNVADAKQMAQDNGIHLAISNPCIELWLWLHFADQPGMRHRHELQKMVKQHIPGYDKHIDFQDCRQGYGDAVRRAKRLDDDAQQDDEEGRNPSTGFWRLTEEITRNV
jgi:hypothetical protein